MATVIKSACVVMIYFRRGNEDHIVIEAFPPTLRNLHLV